MKTTGDGINVSILGKEFLVACPPDQRASLMAAASYLDEKMREIQRSGRVIGTERCAIMAALNIANEFLEIQQNQGVSVETSQQIRNLQSKIDAVLQS